MQKNVIKSQQKLARQTSNEENDACLDFPNSTMTVVVLNIKILWSGTVENKTRRSLKKDQQWVENLVKRRE